MRESSRQKVNATEPGLIMQTKLNLISEIAKRVGESCNNNLAYLMSAVNLEEYFGLLKKGKTTGIDGVSLKDYEENLNCNLEGLVTRMKNQSYKPQPVRRTFIPKADGKLRPLGIPSIEVKIIQKAMARILGAIYGNDFLDFSYGFRPNRSCHHATKRFLKNGNMEEGIVYDIEMGTPQGGIISLIFANIYLHYALDLWIEKVVKPNCRGVVEVTERSP